MMFMLFSLRLVVISWLRAGAGWRLGRRRFESVPGHVGFLFGGCTHSQHDAHREKDGSTALDENALDVVELADKDVASDAAEQRGNSALAGDEVREVDAEQHRGDGCGGDAADANPNKLADVLGRIKNEDVPDCACKDDRYLCEGRHARRGRRPFRCDPLRRGI